MCAMWKVVVDFIEVAGIIAFGVIALMILVCAYLYCKAVIKCMEADELEDRINENFK